jgi:glycosyltransferase involved in cell wall biosynthesis
VRSAVQSRFVLVNQSPSRSLVQLAEQLASRGHEVFLLAGAMPHDTAPFKVHVVRMPRYRSGSMIGRVLSWSSFALRSALWLTTTPADATVIACTNPPVMPFLAVLASRIRHFAVVARVLDVYPDVFKATRFADCTLLRQVITACNRWTYARCSWVETLGNHMARAIAAVAPTTNVIVAPESIDDTGLTRDESQTESRRLLKLPREGCIVLVSGNFGMTHDLRPLVDATTRIRDEPIQFVICTSHRTGICELFAHSENVTVLAALPAPDYHRLLNAADIAVISLRPGAETASFPSRALSYMAAGLPIVAAMRSPGDLSDLLVLHNCGVVVEPHDVRGLVAAIRALAANDAWRLACSTRAREAARAFEARNCIPSSASRLEALASQHFIGCDERPPEPAGK